MFICNDIKISQYNNIMIWIHIIIFIVILKKKTNEDKMFLEYYNNDNKNDGNSHIL